MKERATAWTVAQACAEAIEPGDLVRVALQMGELLGAAGAWTYDFGAGGLPRHIGGTDPRLGSLYTGQYATVDPLASHVRASSQLPFTVIQQRGRAGVIDEEVFRRSPAYLEYYGPHDQEHLLLAFPHEQPLGPRWAAGFLFTRGGKQPPFERRDLRQVERLRPALRTAIERVARWSALVRRQAELTEALGCAQADAYITFDGDRVLESNQAGLNALLRHSGLRALLGAHAKRYAIALRAGDVTALTSVFRDRLSGGSVVSGDLHVLRADDGAHALIAAHFQIIAEPEADALTPAEHRVLNGIACGLSNKEIAQKLAVSVETVRTHVQRILHKLGVDNRVKAAMWARTRPAAGA